MLNKPSYTLIFDLHDVILSYHPEHRGTKNQARVIKAGLEILHNCYAQSDMYGRKRHRLFVLSNASHESHTLYISNFPELFSLFDGIVTSAQTGIQKPDTRIYEYILARYQLNPAECIFIDDKEANVLAAQAVGMKGIVCKDHAAVKQELKKLQVL